MTKISKVSIAGLCVCISSSQAFVPLQTFQRKLSSGKESHHRDNKPASPALQARGIQRYEYDYEEYDDYIPDTRTYEQRPKVVDELSNLRVESDDTVIEDDDYYLDEEVTDSLQTGNFWSNPNKGLDTYPDRARRSRKSLPPSTVARSSRRRDRPSSDGGGGGLAPSIFGSRTTFRSGTSSAPKPFADLYDRFFWYGFDPELEDTTPDGFDKTAFGGMKGKFDGLSYLDETDGVASMPSKRRPRRTREMKFGNDYDYFDENFESGELDEDRISLSFDEGIKLDTPRSEKPVDKIVYEEVDDEPRIRSRRKSSRRKDWVAEEVSGWFDANELEMERGRDTRVERRQKPSTFAEGISGILDGIFKVDRDKMNYDAQAYDRQIGRGKPENNRRSRPDKRRPRDGSDYSFKYDREQDRVRRPFDKYDSDENNFSNVENNADNVVVDVDAEVEEVRPKPPPRKERTWEERALAYERVPPLGVPAWGPSGDLGIDARTQATLDALQQIRDAKNKVEMKEAKVREAKEEVVIIKADAELVKKRASREDPRRIRALLLQIELQLEDAARFLRRARSEEERAREDLADMEDRHWALLSRYDASKASQEVIDTLKEFDAQQPAARPSGGDKTEDIHVPKAIDGVEDEIVQ